MRADCDVLVFGGGAAGLWLLDHLTRQGYVVLLLEAGDLGRGQTIGSQGIIHGGLKYTLQGLLTASASSIREMPGLWRDCLAGRRHPDLRGVRRRSDHCHLWRTDTLASRVGMIGAKFGLRVAPRSLSKAERPPALKYCPGDVARLDEQVVSPGSLLAELAAKHQPRLVQIDAEGGLAIDASAPGFVHAVRLTRPGRPVDAPDELTIRPKQVVFAAGAGNADLRRRAGLSPAAMQRRPLHMILVRGELPELNGHCVDGARTRVTVTSDVDAQGRTVWQVGGQVAEDGVDMDRTTLVETCRAELEAVLPGLDLSHAEFAAYRVDRAEAATAGGKRPDTFQILEEGNVITAWPTKLVLAPLLAEAVAERIRETLPANGGAADSPRSADSGDDADPRRDAGAVPSDWPRPRVSPPPWETCIDWIALPTRSRRAA